MATKTAKRKPITVELREVAYGGSRTIDEAAGVIRDVKVLGYESSNGRTYDPAGIARAIPLYEGIQVNVNHIRGTAERAFESRFGWLESVRQKADGLYADLHYFKTHDLAPRILEAAQRRPQSLGLSHDAQGSTSTKNGKTIVESIRSVRSVDIVGDPATTNSLFESEAKPMTKTLTEVLTGTPYESLLEIEGIDPLLPVAEPIGGGSTDDAIKSAFRAMVIAAFDDEALDSKATIAKIKDILKAQEKVMSIGKKPEAADAEPAVEGRITLAQLPPEVQALIENAKSNSAELACRKLLEEAKVEAKPALLTALMEMASAETRKALIATQPKQAWGQRPRSAAPLSESRDEDRMPTNLKEFAARLR